MFDNYALGIETSVTDLHYPADAGDEELKHNFITALPRTVPGGKVAEAPRKGDMILITREDLDDACRAFARMHPKLFSPSEDPENIRRLLFGMPSYHAGGSLANSFDAMIYSSIDSEALYDGMFITATGVDVAGQVFRESFKGHIASSRGGLQMVSHIIPIDGDRIMITAPSGTDSANDRLTPRLLTKQRLDRASIIMLGGYLHYAGQFVPMADKVARYLRRADENKQVVVTAAAQGIAASPAFQKAVHGLMQVADVTLHANTGEFRRFMNMDEDWRSRFASAFIDKDGLPLQGREAEAAKNAHADYQNAKQAANMDAFDSAWRWANRMDSRLQFVVTNGAKAAHLIEAQEIHRLPNKPIERKEIVSTVGAGDAHVGGYWNGSAQGFPVRGCLALAAMSARAVIQIPEARLPRDAEHRLDGDHMRGPIAAAFTS